MKLKSYPLLRWVLFLAAAAFVIALLAKAPPTSAQVSTLPDKATTTTDLSFDALREVYGSKVNRPSDLVIHDRNDKQFEVKDQWYLDFPHGAYQNTRVTISKKDGQIHNPLGLTWKNGQLQGTEPLYFGEGNDQVIFPGDKLVPIRTFPLATPYDWIGDRPTYRGAPANPLDTLSIPLYQNLVTTSYYDEGARAIYSLKLYPQDQGDSIAVDLVEGHMMSIESSDRKFAFERGMMAGNPLDSAGLKDGDLLRVTDIMWTYYPLFIKDGQKSAWKVNKGKLSAVQMRRTSGEGSFLVHTADTPQEVPSLQRYSVTYSGYGATGRQGCERTTPRTSCHTEFTPRPEDIGTVFKVGVTAIDSLLLEETGNPRTN